MFNSHSNFLFYELFTSFVHFSIGFCPFFLSVSMSSSYMKESSSLWDEWQEFFSGLSFVF